MDHCVGSCTPGAYIEELLIALPSIRAFVDARGDWEFALAETWEILFDALVGNVVWFNVQSANYAYISFADVTYLRYPIYTITGCALIIGIVESIVYKKKTEAAIKARYAPDAATKRRRGMKCECEKLRTKAFKAVRLVEEDIQEILNITRVRLPPFVIMTGLYPDSEV